MHKSWNGQIWGFEYQCDQKQKWGHCPVDRAKYGNSDDHVGQFW